jgi:excisionase family DNA binding protein
MTVSSLAVMPMSPPAPAGPLLKPREVADMLRCSLSMVRALTRRGELPVMYVGRLPRYASDDVAAYLARAREVRR